MFDTRKAKRATERKMRKKGFGAKEINSPSPTQYQDFIVSELDKMHVMKSSAYLIAPKHLLDDIEAYQEIVASKSERNAFRYLKYKHDHKLTFGQAKLAIEKLKEENQWEVLDDELSR